MAFNLRHRLGRSVLTLLAPLAFALGLTTTAESAWLATASSPAAAQARTLSTSATPTTTFSRPKVTLTWTASSFANGGAVPAYVVRRYNAVTGASQGGSNSCAGLVTALTCSENNAPAGTWRYTITSAAGTWRGTESPQSLPIIVA